MNKLNKKIFTLLTSILSLFLLIIIFIFNTSNYNEVKKRVNDSLMMHDKMEDKMPPNDERKKEIKFFEVSVYTVSINNGNISDITSHSINDSNYEEIKAYAKSIIDKNLNGKHIGNLYLEKYSYTINKDNIVIVDNTSINTNLKNQLKTSIILFIALESIIVYIASKLTIWVCKPIEESFEKQKNFIADASHELKTPLTVIMASAESLDKHNKYVKNILTESERMNKLIISLLDLAKTENNKNEFIKEDLSKLILKSILTYESIIYEKGFELSYKVDNNITYLCNSDEIKQVLAILIDNAIKHTTNKGKIIINLKKIKSNIILEVKNQGNPISKEEETKIFERFYKIDKSRNRNDNRYGLGLAIAKNIVNNHGGTITAHSEKGFTNFKIIFKI